MRARPARDGVPFGFFESEGRDSNQERLRKLSEAKESFGKLCEGYSAICKCLWLNGPER
jgi:hypothetical protein